MSERIEDQHARGLCDFTRLGQMEYTGALARQKEILAAKLADPDLPDTVLFVEHPPVYTLGRRGGRENLVVSQDFLDEKGITIVQTDRGGNITYHGPGQAVLYPVVDLERNRLSVPEFVSGLEEIMKLTCREFGVPADRDERNHGIWVGNAKIGSVGISLKKGISIHGLALNINPDLTPFTWINPCGLANQAMTSIARETGTGEQKLDRPSGPEDMDLMDRICSSFARYFTHVFDKPLLKKKENCHAV